MNLSLVILIMYCLKYKSDFPLFSLSLSPSVYVSCFRPLHHSYVNQKVSNYVMSITNNSFTTTTTFERHFSFPASINSNRETGIFTGRRCSSTTVLPTTLDQDLKIPSHTLDRHIQLNLNENRSWLERCKQRVTKIFKQISKPTIKQGKYTAIQFSKERERERNMQTGVCIIGRWMHRLYLALSIFFSFHSWVCYCETSKGKKQHSERRHIDAVSVCFVNAPLALILTSSKYFPLRICRYRFFWPLLSILLIENYAGIDCIYICI